MVGLGVVRVARILSALYYISLQSQVADSHGLSV